MTSRKILFRGWTGAAWIYGDLITQPQHLLGELADKPCILHDDGIDEVDHATIGQFTGLTDRHGKEIFEGDVVKYKDYSGGARISFCGKDVQPRNTGIVMWDDKRATFYLSTKYSMPSPNLEPEITGTIHATPTPEESKK